MMTRGHRVSELETNARGISDARIDEYAGGIVFVHGIKDLDLAQRSQSKYSRTWNLDLQLLHMSKKRLEDDKQTTSYKLELQVVFTASMKTKLTRLRRKDVQIDEQKILLQTKIIKGERIREYKIEMKRLRASYCPVRALETCLKDENMSKEN
ncbi:MAG: hypothetical protein EZS28_051151 [Streblomastix strix]|uniref:Uncharacterized protein n=1 Tax=Streblomastix strix TaxID=222440 RepID=A0A5J4T5N1_9EUKA|nr:MAG: hypothetical protein EZS28_051151 [Streblomastix strix]